MIIANSAAAAVVVVGAPEFHRWSRQDPFPWSLHRLEVFGSSLLLAYSFAGYFYSQSLTIVVKDMVSDFEVLN